MPEEKMFRDHLISMPVDELNLFDGGVLRQQVE